jgi:hypothetical protein
VAGLALQMVALRLLALLNREWSMGQPTFIGILSNSPGINSR